MGADGYRGVTRRIEEAADRSARDPADITLVVVSKSRSAEEVRQIYDEGHRDFGENRAEELAAKAPLLPDDIRWHFVGSVQRRKAAVVRDLTVLLHSMDRMSLARRWASLPGDPPPCLLQVNVGEEEQKHGVLTREAGDVLTDMADLGIRPIGLMAIPPAPVAPEDSRPHFRVLAELFAELRAAHPGLAALSMGMTDDFEVAVEEGATLLRVGRAIFGPRSN